MRTPRVQSTAVHRVVRELRYVDDLASVRRKTRKSLILQGVPPILSGEDRRDVVFFAGDLPRIDPFRDHLRDIAIMREVHRSQFQLGQVPIEEIWINPKSRDDIPAVLKGLQHIWCEEELRERLFALLDEHILPEADRTVGRPGMELWQILVLGVLKQGLGCDFDRIHELTNHHDTIRAFLGHSDFGDKTHYEYQTVVDNVSLLTPELLSAVGRLVVESGHKVAKKKPGEPLRGRCDSFVVETDVHYPTDVNLLWDAVRWCARLTGEGQPVEVRRKEGVTNHFRPESCAGRCEAAGEALTGARTGRAIEHRKRERLERRDCHSGRRQHRHHRNGEGMAGSCARLTGEG